MTDGRPVPDPAGGPGARRPPAGGQPADASPAEASLAEASPANEPPVSADDDPSVAVEWLHVLGELGSPAGHEIRNVLNGVSVNLEVVRSRSALGAQASERILPFADAAVEQVEQLATLLDLVLSLLRPPPEPLDLARLLQRMGLLFDALGHGRGGSVAVAVPRRQAPTLTAASGTAARLLMLRLLLEAFDPPGELSCELVEGTQPAFRLWRSGRPLPVPSARLVGLADRAGARVDSDSGGWSVVFPPSATQG